MRRGWTSLSGLETEFIRERKAVYNLTFLDVHRPPLKPPGGTKCRPVSTSDPKIRPEGRFALERFKLKCSRAGGCPFVRVVACDDLVCEVGPRSGPTGKRPRYYLNCSSLTTAAKTRSWGVSEGVIHACCYPVTIQQPKAVRAHQTVFIRQMEISTRLIASARGNFFRCRRLSVGCFSHPVTSSPLT